MDTKEQFVITINRELGSGGRTVGRKLAERLAVKYYDKQLLEELISQFGLSQQELEKVKGRRQNWWTELCDKIVPAPMVDLKDDSSLLTTADVYKLESDILKDIASAESCIIAGRSGFFILKDHPNKLSVFLYASKEHRIERVMRKQGLSREEAIEVIDKVDKGRENYTRHYSGRSRYDARNYDLCLCMDGLSEEKAMELILRYIRN